MVKLDVIVVQVFDAGEWFNQLRGRRYFRPGEVLQVHCIINQEHVWIEHDTRFNKFQIGFGECPAYGVDVLTDEQAQAVFLNHFGGVR